MEDLSRRTFGRLEVISYYGKDKHGKPLWLCRCKCGTAKVVTSNNLKSEHTKSCGCLRLERVIEASTKHGYVGTLTYKCRQKMKERCFNINDKQYHDYGGRGIVICERWLVFENFLADMGERPDSSYSLDRINNDGNYEPGNCRWATSKEQQHNKRSNVRYEWNGKNLTLCEWESITGVKYMTLYMRLNKLGWSVEKALTTKETKA
jgi:hypothetical protein